MKKAAAVLLATLLCAVALPAPAQSYQLVVAGASPGGLWSNLGIGIDRAMKTAYPGSVVTYQTSGGGLANIALLDEGKVSLGIAHNAELKLAIAGAKPFNHPIKSMRAIAYLYNWAPMQLVMTKDFATRHGIRTFEDIAVKKPPLRVAVNRRGNIAATVAERMFAAIGVTPEDIKRWGGEVIYAASNEQTTLYKDGRIDLIFNSLFVKQGSLIDATESVASVLLPVSDATIAKVDAEMGTQKYVIPANSYKGQTEPVPTATLGAGLVTNDRLDDQTAYALAKALHQQIAQVQGVHKSMQALTPELLVSFAVIPYHPGAVRYYKEAGLMK
ncbi:MAG: TAXI family TRAP transporter solute-binding subunit [Burkholderiales bacterium]